MLLNAFAPSQLRFDFGRKSAPVAAAGWVRRDEAIMGTSIAVEVWADDARSGAAACAAVIDEMHRIDRLMSPHKAGSELSRINREAAQRTVALSDEMFRLIERAIEFSRVSNGAFDITYAAVGQHYDYRTKKKPDAKTLAAAREAVGWQHLQLDGHARTLRFGKSGMRIDLGGFAKGHAVDNAAAILQRRGIRHAIVSAGGDSRVIGDRRGRPWSVAIRDPRSEAGHVAVLPLEDCSISTSGDYERYFDETDAGGQVVRHHHLIDPATGRSPAGEDRIRSVTVLAPDGLTSEALSKCVFVLGLERGMALVDSLPGADAVAVDADGRLHVSQGLLDLKERDPRAATLASAADFPFHTSSHSFQANKRKNLQEPA